MEHTSDSSLSARRRSICQRILARYASSGIVLDDPAFLRVVEAWVAGEIKMTEAATQWNNIRLSRATEHRATIAFTNSEHDPLASFVNEKHEEGDLDHNAGDHEEPEWIRAMSKTKMER